MLTAFFRAFRTPDLRRKLLFTLAIMALYRFGAHIPLPGVDTRNLAACTGASAHSNTNNQAFGLLNLFSGGALLQLSIFALGITPYITASIILQLLTVVIPRLETLKKEGQAGQAKITQYTRYLTIGLSVLESAVTLTAARDNPGYLLGDRCRSVAVFYPRLTWEGMAVMVVIMTAATSLLMWLGELVTDRGVGNGMSVLIFTSIAARLPSEGWSIKTNKGWGIFALIMAIGLVVITAVVLIEQAQRRVPVQYAKRMIGRKMYGGTSTYIPIKVNQAGVIPVIFASSLLYLPQLALQLMDANHPNWVYRFINNHLIKQNDWVNITLFALLIVFFTYFYVSITFNPTEVADNMRKYGGFVPGIRPGKPTSEYLDFILSRITLAGALYLAIISVLPNFFFIWLNQKQYQNFPFGGTAVLIMVGVGLETVKQIESQLMQRNYEGFLR